MRRPHAVLLLPLLAALAGARCEVKTPPPPEVVDARGEVDAAGFDELVAAAEQARGLPFVRRPALVLVDPDAPAPAGRAEAVGAMAATEAPATPEEARVWIEPDAALVFARRPPDVGALRLALGHLLDAQQFPRLAELAPRLQGDAGLAVRGLLAGSARATASGRWLRSGGGEAGELLASLPEWLSHPDRIPQATFGDAAALAPLLLFQLEDPNQAFRRPPLSTLQLMSPAAYHARRPLRLLGTPPALPGCRVSRDESVGVLRLLHGAAAGGLAPGDESIAAWRGDRLVRYACEEERAPWLYVVELDDEGSARSFEPRIGARLPRELARPAASAGAGRRVVAWHALPSEAALGFASRLEAREATSLEDFLGGPAGAAAATGSRPPAPSAP